MSAISGLKGKLVIAAAIPDLMAVIDRLEVAQAYYRKDWSDEDRFNLKRQMARLEAIIKRLDPADKACATTENQ